MRRLRLASRLLAALATSLVMVSQAQAAQAADWLYFDLGEVIVTGNPTTGYTYVPGAMDYLQAMRAKGFKLALITNIPEAWGATCGAKFATLRTFLGERLHETVPMDWSKFDAVIVPPFDRYRKPHNFMFLAGLAHACPGRALYIGEQGGEIAAARELGLATYHAALPTPDQPHPSPLPTEAQVAGFLATDFLFQQPDSCDFAEIVTPELEVEDQETGVDACVVDPLVVP